MRAANIALGKRYWRTACSQDKSASKCLDAAYRLRDLLVRQAIVASDISPKLTPEILNTIIQTLQAERDKEVRRNRSIETIHTDLL